MEMPFHFQWKCCKSTFPELKSRGCEGLSPLFLAQRILEGLTSMPLNGKGSLLAEFTRFVGERRKGRKVSEARYKNPGLSG